MHQIATAHWRDGREINGRAEKTQDAALSSHGSLSPSQLSVPADQSKLKTGEGGGELSKIKMCIYIKTVKHLNFLCEINKYKAVLFLFFEAEGGCTPRTRDDGVDSTDMSKDRPWPHV